MAHLGTWSFLGVRILLQCYYMTVWGPKSGRDRGMVDLWMWWVGEVLLHMWYKCAISIKYVYVCAYTICHCPPLLRLPIRALRRFLQLRVPTLGEPAPSYGSGMLRKLGYWYSGIVWMMIWDPNKWIDIRDWSICAGGQLERL